MKRIPPPIPVEPAITEERKADTDNMIREGMEISMSSFKTAQADTIFILAPAEKP